MIHTGELAVGSCRAAGEFWRSLGGVAGLLHVHAFRYLRLPRFSSVILSLLSNALLTSATSLWKQRGVLRR